MNAIKDPISQETIAKSMLAYCYNSELGEFHLNDYLTSKNIPLENDKASNYLKLSLSAFRLAAAVVTLREKFDEDAEPIVRLVYKLFTDISASGEFYDVGMTLSSLCKWYCANWSQVPPENELLPFPGNETVRKLLALFLIKPLEDHSHGIEINDDLCTLIYRNMGIAQGTAKIIIAQVERDFGFVHTPAKQEE